MTKARDIASTAVLDSDIGSTVQAYDATNVNDADIGVTVQAYITPGTSGNVLTSDGSQWTSAAAAAFDSGTRLMFAQTAAPTGWTKDTVNYNEHSLRVTTGTASTGGTVDFTTAFTSQTPTGSVTITSVTGSAGATTLSTSQMPSHRHDLTLTPTYSNISGWSPQVYSSGYNGSTHPQATTTTGIQLTGGGSSHSHPFSFSSGSGTFSGAAMNLAVKYLDVITATKD